MKPRYPLGIRPVGFQPADDAHKHCLGDFDSIFRVLRQRASEISHLHFGMLELHVTRYPLSPAVQRDDADTSKRNKRRRPQWEARQAGFVGRGNHRVRFSDQENSHARLIYL